ncbi:hypothetical protein ABEF95_014685 [Exophiala dermatitidis]
MFVGAALQASSFGVPQMLVGRIVCGIGNGFNTATTPLWICESIPAEKRGRHVAFSGNLIAFGIVIAYYINIGLSYTTDGFHGEALDILAQLCGRNIFYDDQRVQAQKAEIDEALALENEGGKWKISEVWQDGPLRIRRRYLMVIAIQAMQQLSGINVLVYYAPHTLTTDLGFSYKEALHVAAGIAVTYWLFSYSQVFFLD